MHFSASSVSFSGLHDKAVSYVLVMYYSVSCVLPHQLCVTRSVVYFSVSCALLDQFCITQSVVSDSVSCVTLSQLDDNSVSCVLFQHLCITPSGEINPLFPISIFEILSNFTQLQVTQLIEVVKQKIISNLGILSPELLKCFIFPLFTVSQSPQF